MVVVVVVRLWHGMREPVIIIVVIMVQWCREVVVLEVMDRLW